MQKIKEKIMANKSEIIASFVSTFIWGIIAHSYMFFSNAFSHDSLHELVYIDLLKISSGRPVGPLIKKLTTGDVTIPWINGILSLIYISLATFLIVKMFKTKSKKSNILISGILTVNITVISTIATYIHDLDTYAFSVLLATFGVYLFRNYKKGYLYAIILSALVMGIYQCNISIMITLIIMLLILDLLNSVEYKKVLLNGIKSVGILIAGGILYLILAKIATSCTGVPLLIDSHNNRRININIKSIIGAWIGCIHSFINVPSIYAKPISIFIQLLLITSIIIVIINIIRSKKYNIKVKLLIMALFLILPLGMNTVYIIDGGLVHDVMKYAHWMLYMFIIILAEREEYTKIKGVFKEGVMSNIICIMIFITLCGNISLANQLYLKKNMEKDITLSYMTRVAQRIEEYEDYDSYNTKVAFIGKPYIGQVIPGFEKCEEITGGKTVYGISMQYYEFYYKYILNTPIKLVEGEEEIYSLYFSKEVRDMPAYPKEGCIKMVNDVLVVKLGNYNL